MKHCAVAVTRKEFAELVPVEMNTLGQNEVRGRTLCTLISPGTELAWNYQGEKFPTFPGYAAVFKAEEFGSDVKGIAPGTLLFCMGPHRSFQQANIKDTVAVPVGLAPEKAVIARLMGVSMTTLMTTTARPGDLVAVSGAGPVGYLAVHMFAMAGYDVMVTEPNEARRTQVEQSGIRKVFPGIPLDNPAIAGKIALVVECSGHEQAVLDGCKAVRRLGEVVLVGVPWRKLTELTAHDLLHAVFHKFAVLRSGWEWEVPNHASDFNPQSIFSGLEKALKWLAEGRIPLDNLSTLHTPDEIQSVYQSHLKRSVNGLFSILDWNGLDS